MSSPPSSPSREPFTNITNDASISPHLVRQGKRRAQDDLSECKRIKFELKPDVSQTHESFLGEPSSSSLPSLVACRQNGLRGLRHALRTGDAVARRLVAPSTEFLLRSFVSSDKADVFQCHSMDSTYLVPPYACAYSNASKRGEANVLAVATEQGTVDLLNTSRRENDWDPEPPKSSLQIHNNGVFDVKWSATDRLLATGAGDRTIGICDPRAFTGSPLQVLDGGHTSSVKCLDWDPSSDNILASGGRDGRICLWDLRTQNRKDVSDRFWRPVMEIPYAHEVEAGKPTKNGGKSRSSVVLAPRSVTSVAFQPTSSHEILSAGSGNGMIRKWDLRSGPRSGKSKRILPVQESAEDLTTASHDVSAAGLPFSPRRARGISSMAFGTGPSGGRIFALTTDSRIHTYNSSGAAYMPLAIPQPDIIFSHRHMATNSFYVRLSVSPCGRWLACGGASGSAFIFDVASGSQTTGVELKGQVGEVGAVDWANGTLATCADDGIVRIWRPDLEKSGLVDSDPDGAGFGWCAARP